MNHKSASPNFVELTDTDRRVFNVLGLRTPAIAIGTSDVFGYAVCDDGSNFLVSGEATENYFRWHISLLQPTGGKNVRHLYPAGRVFGILADNSEIALRIDPGT